MVQVAGRSVTMAVAAIAAIFSLVLAGPGGAQARTVRPGSVTWHQAIEVPGTARLNKGRSASTYVASCASAGNCGAGGPCPAPLAARTGHVPAAA
jgi:hypothetical protein